MHLLNTAFSYNIDLNIFLINKVVKSKFKKLLKILIVNINLDLVIKIKKGLAHFKQIKYFLLVNYVTKKIPKLVANDVKQLKTLQAVL